jgi:hypothetical protein
MLLASPVARTFWWAQLEAVSEVSIESMPVRVPKTLLSVQSRMFCLELLKLNRRRLLDVH